MSKRIVGIAVIVVLVWMCRVCMGQPKVSPTPIKIVDYDAKSDAAVLSNKFASVNDPSSVFEELRKAQQSSARKPFRWECKAWLNFDRARDPGGAVLKLDILQQRKPSFIRVVKNYQATGGDVKSKAIPENDFKKAIFTDVLTPTQLFLIRRLTVGKPSVEIKNHQYHNELHQMLQPWRLHTVRYGIFDLEETVDILQSEWKRDKKNLVVKRSKELVQIECPALRYKLIFNLKQGGSLVYSERSELSFHTCIESRLIKVGSQWIPREVLYKQFSAAAKRVERVFKLTFYEHQLLRVPEKIPFDVSTISTRYSDKRFRLGFGDRQLKRETGKPLQKILAGPEDMFLGLVRPKNEKRFFILATIPEDLEDGQELGFEIRGKDSREDFFQFKKSSIDEFEKYSRSADPWYVSIDSYPNLRVYEVIPRSNKIPAGRFLSYVNVFHPSRASEKIAIKISGYRCE